MLMILCDTGAVSSISILDYPLQYKPQFVLNAHGIFRAVRHKEEVLLQISYWSTFYILFISWSL